MADNDDSVLGQLLEEDQKSGGGDDKSTSPDVETLQKQLEYEKQRNDSLQGRVDSQLKPLTQTVRDLQQQLARSREPEKKVDIPAAVTVQDIIKELTPEEREAVGEKQLAILARLIEKPTQAVVERVREELRQSFEQEFGSRVAALESQLTARAGEDLWDKVDALSPGAKAANDGEDPRWVEFLGRPDPISGRLRHHLGNAAVDAGDVGRLALLHNEFLKSIGREPDKAKSQDDSGMNLRPEGSRAEPGVSGSDKPRVRQDEIDAFYADLAKGKYEGKPELVDKMESVIMAAIQEGRVV